MEELLELRQLLEQGKMHEALLLVDELEEMSLSDKINKIDSVFLMQKNNGAKVTECLSSLLKNCINGIMHLVYTQSWKDDKMQG